MWIQILKSNFFCRILYIKMFCDVSDIVVFVSFVLGGAGFPHLTADLTLSQCYQIGKKTWQRARKWTNNVFTVGVLLAEALLPMYLQQSEYASA